MRVRLLATCAAVASLALAGCAGGRSGSIRWDSGIQLSFETAQVLPGYRYFSAGSDTNPDAILALREDRPLRTDNWRQVAMTPETLARLVDRMRGTRVDGPYGGVVLDDGKTKIGMWYSLMKPSPVKLLDDGGVIVNLPTQRVDGGLEGFGARGR